MKVATDWTEDGAGATLAALLTAAGRDVLPGDEMRATNLRLTGEPWTEYDFERLRFATVGYIGSAGTAAQVAADAKPIGGAS